MWLGSSLAKFWQMLGSSRSVAVLASSYLCWVCVLLATNVAVAQPTVEKKGAADEKKSDQSPPKTNPAVTAADGKTPATSDKATDPKRTAIRVGVEDVVPLIGPDGKVMLIPRLENWEEFREWVKSRATLVGTTAPDFSISSITFEGTTEGNEETANVVATASILLNREEGSVLVPLRLNEATFLKPVEHRGAGAARFEQFDRDQGYRCWLSGKGQHDLVMTLAIPVRRQAAARRLLLSLPVTPVSGLKLAVPLPKISVKSSERTVVRTNALEGGRSEIQAFGLGNLLDLNWQTLSDTLISKPELQASTLISADLRSEALVLEVTQLVRSIQGSFDKLVVRLPPEFELVEAVSGSEVKSSTVVAGTPARVAIDLVAPTQGPVTLKWLLSAKVASGATSLPVIEGFEVEDSRRQSGFVKINSWEGLNLRKHPGEDRFLHQASDSELRDIPGFLAASGNQHNTSVFRFLKQPFRLVLDAHKVEPYFSADPLHVVKFLPGRMEWEGTIGVRVYRGALTDLVLPWPRFKAEGWEQVTTDTPDLVEKISVEDSAAGSALRLAFVDRKGRNDGEFEVRLKARRTLPSDGVTFDLSLPSVAMSGRKASRIVFAPASNLEVSGVPKDQVAVRSAAIDEEVLDVLESARNAVAWRCDAGAPDFTASAKVQQQTIQTQSTSELKLDVRSIGVTQQITYDVGFEPLSQVRLMIPKATADRIRFTLRDGSGGLKSLTPFFTGLEIDQQRQLRLPLENVGIGQFTVIAEFELARSSELIGSDAVLISVPVLQSSDAEFSATRVQWKSGERTSVTLEDPAWQPELVAEKTALWRVAGAKNSIALKLLSLAEAAQQDFIVQRAIIRTVMSEGRSHSQAMFEIDSPAREIMLVLPPEVSAKDFRVWWNRKPVEPTRRSLPTGEVQLQILTTTNPSTDVSSSGDSVAVSESSLWLDYYSNSPTRFASANSHQLAVPQFATTVWVAQTIWEVVLPPDQHMLTTPRGFASQFHWTRGTLLWSRTPNFGYDRIEQSIRSGAPTTASVGGWDSLPSDEFTGNSYPLSCFGPPQTLHFESMSRSAVVGCGAGLALVLGFLLIRIPSTRHVLTFLTLGFVMAMTALWFAEPVKVLLQPAVLGASMAVVAAMIDRVGRRERQTPIVTLSSPSDFYTGSSIVPGSSHSIDRDAPTIAPISPLSEPVPASNHGGRE